MGRILFESEELKQRFYEVQSFCEEHHIDIDIDCIGFESYELRKSEEFDLTEFLNKDDFESDINFTYDTEISIGLPRSDDNEVISFRFFYQSMVYALQGSIKDNMQFTSPYQVLVHVECDFLFLEKLEIQEYSIKQLWNDTEIEVSIVQGLTSFGIRLTIDGEYDKYYPPMHSNDTFIKVQARDATDPKIFEEIIQSFIFELQCTFSLSVQRSRRITGLYYIEDDEDDAPDSAIKPQIRMRPLMNGKGIFSLLKIYNSCNEVVDDEYRILNYTKVIEYVSQTVVRKEMLDSALKRLYSPRALQPNATYILELEQLFDEHRNNKKDHQAIRLTVETCCDLNDLIDVAPMFLRKFNDYKKNVDNKDLRSACLEELAGAISDTRNMIAHAKTNYSLKGKECPSDQVSGFANCLKIVAIQVIRWFSRQHEDSRIV